MSSVVRHWRGSSGRNGRASRPSVIFTSNNFISLHAHNWNFSSPSASRRLIKPQLSHELMIPEHLRRKDIGRDTSKANSSGPIRLTSSSGCLDFPQCYTQVMGCLPLRLPELRGNAYVDMRLVDMNYDRSPLVGNQDAFP